ncbi:MAG: hypothetical protein MK105_13150 [Crocinitomicaceae bacterium]|nr:hypothetical protein [Crocinitomicaceae bacterium]
MQEDNHTLIHSNSFGYISQCNCCQELQLCFGNLILVLEQSDFVIFKSSFFGLNNISSASIHRADKTTRYSIMTSYPDITLSLSKHEFEMASDLLNLAEIRLFLKKEFN